MCTLPRIPRMTRGGSVSFPASICLYKNCTLFIQEALPRIACPVQSFYIFFFFSSGDIVPHSQFHFHAYVARSYLWGQLPVYISVAHYAQQSGRRELFFFNLNNYSLRALQRSYNAATARFRVSALLSCLFGNSGRLF